MVKWTAGLERAPARGRGCRSREEEDNSRQRRAKALLWGRKLQWVSGTVTRPVWFGMRAGVVGNMMRKLGWGRLEASWIRSVGTRLKELWEHPRFVSGVKGHERPVHMQRWADVRMEGKEGLGASSGAAEQLHGEISRHEQIV